MCDTKRTIQDQDRKNKTKNMKPIKHVVVIVYLSYISTSVIPL